MRAFQSNIFPWEVILSPQFIKEIKPSHSIVSVVIMNVGTASICLWGDVLIEPGASLPITADQSAFLSLSRVPVSRYVNDTGEDKIFKVVVLVEKVTPIKTEK